MDHAEAPYAAWQAEPVTAANPATAAGSSTDASVASEIALDQVTEQPHSAPRTARRLSLAPYQVWPSRALPHPETAQLAEIVAGLLDIVAVEGPMHAHRAYRVYTQAAGGHRVGPEMRRTFHAATRQALRSGVLQQLDEDMLVPDEKTLYIPGEPPVMMRVIGPRQLSDIPRSEVAELIKNLDLGGSPADVIKRAVLNAYGLIRLTARTGQYLDECLSYSSSGSPR